MTEFDKSYDIESEIENYKSIEELNNLKLRCLGKITTIEKIIKGLRVDLNNLHIDKENCERLLDIKNTGLAKLNSDILKNSKEADEVQEKFEEMKELEKKLKEGNDDNIKLEELKAVNSEKNKLGVRLVSLRKTIEENQFTKGKLEKNIDEFNENKEVYLSEEKRCVEKIKSYEDKLKTHMNNLEKVITKILKEERKDD